MKIALVGYGRMGHMIEEIALERGHEVVCRIDAADTDLFESSRFKSADVAIEFSQPAAAVGNVLRCFAAGVPVVSGTTGWSNSLPEIMEMCGKGAGTLIWSSNFSIGVYVFRAVNRYLTELMNRFPDYSPSLTEVHHIHKLDHPSGTAITIAEDMVEASDRLGSWAETEGEPLLPGVLPVAHERRGEVPGIHCVQWDSDCDSITLTHSAKSRRGFALGAVMAAEWLKERKGFFTIHDMLGF